jgi:hypothetical protein
MMKPKMAGCVPSWAAVSWITLFQNFVSAVSGWYCVFQYIGAGKGMPAST